MKREITRIIDANLNRTKEALRVCEEIARFAIEDPALTKAYKKIRHKITGLTAGFKIDFKCLLNSRDSGRDVGAKSLSSENKRTDIADIFFANSQRLKESIRVLEEFSKVIDKRPAEKFKNLRFEIYALEKKASKKLLSLCYN